MRKAVFRLPDSAEAAIAAMAVIQDFANHEKFRATQFDNGLGGSMPPYDWQIHIQMSSSQLYPNFERILTTALGCVTIEYDRTDPMRGDQDLMYDFDHRRAYEIALPTKRHMVQTFGLELGLDPPIVPDLTALPDDLCQDIRSRDVIVGRRSAKTYLACCLHKPVVEIYPTCEHKNWLSKWSWKYYQMIYHDNPSSELIERARSALWERYQASLNESKIQTAQLPSGVVNAVAK